MVRLKQLVEETGLDKSVILKAAKKMDIVYQKEVFEAHGMQEVVFTEEDANRLRERYKHRLEK